MRRMPEAYQKMRAARRETRLSAFVPHDGQRARIRSDMPHEQEQSVKSAYALLRVYPSLFSGCREHMFRGERERSRNFREPSAAHADRSEYRQSGRLPCFLAGRLCFLFSSMTNAFTTRDLVSSGRMTSSTNPRAAAT